MKAALGLVLLSTLAGCGSVEPLPEEVFLRLNLPTSNGASAAPRWTSGELRVAPVKASGLYRERALAFSKDGGTSLQLHRYLLWLDTPSEMVQQTLVEFLQARGVAPQVVTTQSPATALELAATVTKYEQLIAGQASVMQAEIAFQLREPGGESLFVKAYRAEEVSPDDSPATLATVMARVIANVYSQFANDATVVLQPAVARE
ncbi:MAG: hypothetical protein EXR86_04900 [Gammaproteobacteria bacterium]|nr:hypothetical protein [Gammaproteobacteria bacterium]